MNFRLISHANDYFATDTSSLPLLHVWSLSIEEQFYLLFPLLCVLIWKICKKNYKYLGGFVILFTFLSFCSCVLTINQVYRFYFPLTRFWELGLGIILAYTELFLFRMDSVLSKGFRSFLSLIGIALIIGSIVFYSSNSLIPNWITLLAVTGAVILITANSDSFVNRNILSWRPIAFIGLISYSLYLWHWPFICYFNLIFGEATFLARMGVLFLVLLVSILSYFLIEVPLRRNNSKLIVPILFLMLVICVSLPYGIRKGVFPPVWLDQSTTNSLNKNPSWSPSSYPTMTINGADVSVSGTNPKPTILVAGDSHVGMYFDRVIESSKKLGINSVLLYSGACFITDGAESDPNNVTNSCLNAATKFHKLLESKEIKVLLLGQKWGMYSGLGDENGSRRGEKLKKILDEFIARGGKVFVLMDIPWVKKGSDEFRKRNYFRKALWEGNAVPWNEWKQIPIISPLPKESTWKDGNEKIKKFLPSRVQLIESASKVCPQGHCDLRAYRDEDHILRNWARDHASWLDPVFEQAAQMQNRP